MRALQGESEAAKQLLANANSSAAVARRLAEKGTAVEVCSLAEVSDGCEWLKGVEGVDAKSSAAVASRLAEEGTAVEVCSLAQVSDGC